MSKQASSLRVDSGFLGHIPSQTLTRVPTPPYLSIYGGEGPQVLSHTAGANSSPTQMSAELSAAQLAPATRFHPLGLSS